MRSLLTYALLATMLDRSCIATSADEDPVFIAKRLKQNREIIHTIDCRFEIAPRKKPHPQRDSPSNHIVKVHWRQLQGTIRWDETSDWSSLNNSYLWKDGIKKALASQTFLSGGNPVTTGSYMAAIQG